MGISAKHEWGDVQPLAGSYGNSIETRKLPQRIYRMFDLGHQSSRLSPTDNTWIIAKIPLIRSRP